jgi:hypothetical protein
MFDRRCTVSRHPLSSMVRTSRSGMSGSTWHRGGLLIDWIVTFAAATYNLIGCARC